MAIWKRTPYVTKSIISQFGRGLNSALTPQSIDDNELTDGDNISSSNFPAVATRKGMNVWSTLLSTEIWGIGSRNNEYLHFADNKLWGYFTASTTYVTVTSSLSTAALAGWRAYGEFAEFATESVLYTIWASTLNHLAWDGTTALPVDMSTDCPLTNLIATHKGRIFMAKDKTVYFSALLKTTDWITADDAGNIPIVNARGNITGIKEFADHIMIFTNDGIYELFGDGPDNFELADLSNDVGCVSHRTIQETNGLLYWLDYNGVYAYDGNNLPVTVGERVEKWASEAASSYLLPFTDACAVAHENRYYLSVIDPSRTYTWYLPNHRTLMFDTITQSWHKHTNVPTGVTQLHSMNKTLYAADYQASVLRMDSGFTDNSSSIVWSFVTKMFEGSGFHRDKTVHSIDLTYEYKGSTHDDYLYVDYSASSGYKRIKSYWSTNSELTTGLNTKRLFISTTDLSNVSYYKLRVTGKGHFLVHELTRNERTKKESF